MSTLVDILVPEDQKEGTEIELGAWLKRVGDRVQKDEPVAELVTDKAVVELPAPAAGVLVEILVAAEARVGLDAVLGRIRAEAEAKALETRAPIAPAPARPEDETVEVRPPAAALFSERPDRPRPHPAVARFAARHGLDLERLEGSGRGGRVTRQDVLRASDVAAPPVLVPSPRDPLPSGELGPSRRVRHDPMRRSIARNLAESVRTAPHVTAMFECDLGAVLRDREARKDALAARGVKLTLSAYFLQATVAAVRAVPEVNARWHDDALEIFESLHVGVGTALEDRGLVVPVVRDVQALDLEGCAERLGALIEKARAGKLAPAEMRGSTFTISNHGVMGSLLASPIIINPPESAILGIGKLERRPVVVGEGAAERVEIRPRMFVTLTIDHRALDAFHTNRFLQTFCAHLERWGRPA